MHADIQFITPVHVYRKQPAYGLALLGEGLAVAILRALHHQGTNSR